MNRGTLFRRNLFSAFVVLGMLFAAVVVASVKLYTATAEDYPSEVESQDISKQRALEKAVKKAKKEAGVYLKSYSRMVNSELSDEEIMAITSNSYKIVGEPKYTREIIKHSDETQIIVWKVNVEVEVDDAEIQSWLKRDGKDKSTIISQTREANKASDENERQIEDLREKYNRATSQAERDRIIKQMNDADRDFLANQKLEEGLKLNYAGDFEGAIKLYTESIEINPNNAIAYNTRGSLYNSLSLLNSIKKNIPEYEEFSKKAINDLDKAIQLDINYSEAYGNRGFAHFNAKNYSAAIKDYNRSIELNPNNIYGYVFRALYWQQIAKDNNRALADYNKALVIAPKNSYIYSSRAGFYQYELEDFARATEDLSKAIQFETYKPLITHYYYNRAECYQELKLYEKAIDDFTKAIPLMERDKNFKILVKYAYNKRGKCYQQLGEEAKAQADFAKAKELGYNG